MTRSDLSSICLPSLTYLVNSKHYTLPCKGYKQLLTAEQSILDIFLFTGLLIASGLLTGLEAYSSPTLGWFRNLPIKLSSDWAVYAIVLEMSGCKPLLYISSATSVKEGMQKRMQVCTSTRGDRRPFNMVKALKDGLSKTHVALSLSIPMPEPAMVRLHRHFIVAIEAMLSFAFWAMHSKRKLYNMGHICK